MALYKAAEGRITREDLAEHAVKSAELSKEILPEKLEWIQGVAEATGIDYTDLLIFNFSDKLVGGMYGECTTFMAQGSPVAGGGTIISKNRDQSINTLSEVAVQEAATYPQGSVYKAAMIEIPQVEKTNKFVGSRTSGRWGYGMGVNEHQVIVADNDANSRDYLQFEEGLHDNDVIRLILERATTAREGVTIAARLVEKYGQAWNGIMFEIGDPNELWIMEVTGQRWVAKKYTNTVTARSNQYQLTNDYDIASADIYSFANKMGWNDAPKKQKMNFRKTYGTYELYPEDNSDVAKRPSAEVLYNTEMRYQRAMELLTQKTAAGALEYEDFFAMARDHFDTYKLPSGEVVDMKQVPFYSSDIMDWYTREWMVEYPQADTIEQPIYIRSSCSHDLGWGATSATGVLVARENIPDGLGVMFHSFMPPCQGTFVPFYVGISQVDSRFSTPEASDKFHSIVTKSFGFYGLYIEGIRAAFDPYEEAMLKEVPLVEAKYTELMKAGKTAEAQKLLNEFVAGKCDSALKAADLALANMKQAAIDESAW